jgi:hypothetical protein
VVDDSEKRKLDAIVGAAVRALAESGADDAFVGAFAAAHRDKVATILGIAEQKQQQPPDLLDLVTEAVQKAMAGVQTVPRKPAGSSAVTRVYVTLNGKPTSLSLDKERVLKLKEALGAKEARRAISELAQSAPQGVKNRSGWVEARMLNLTPQTTGAHQQRH